jgi:hypothetical protein
MNKTKLWNFPIWLSSYIGLVDFDIIKLNILLF